MLSLTTMPAQPPVQNILNLEAGKLIRVVCRLRLANETPYVYETSYIPAEFLGDATGDEIALYGLYNTMLRYGGVQIDKATETFEAVLAPQYVAEALGRKGVLSVMQLDRVAFSGGRAVEYCSGFICGDKYRFRVTLE
jgi:GntR family transcriptional regulator